MKNKEKFAVDRIEGNIAILENLNTKEIKLVDINFLPNIKEKDILVYRDNSFFIDEEEKKKREKMIEEKLERIKNIK